MRTFGLNRLTTNVIGQIRPFHKPAKNPAGLVLGLWYFEPGPATDRIFMRVKMNVGDELENDVRNFA